MDLYGSAMSFAISLFIPLLLCFWLILMVGIGHWVYDGARNLGRTHSLVDAQIIDQRMIRARIHYSRISRIGTCPVYRLRYEFDAIPYEIEYLVTNEHQVMLDKNAGTFKLYVPHDRPADARVEYNPLQLLYGLIMTAAMVYGSWRIAPFLLFGE
jgi:hypothetical protein